MILPSASASGNIIFQSAIKIDIALTKVPYLYNIWFLAYIFYYQSQILRCTQ